MNPDQKLECVHCHKATESTVDDLFQAIPLPLVYGCQSCDRMTEATLKSEEHYRLEPYEFEPQREIEISEEEADRAIKSGMLEIYTDTEVNDARFANMLDMLNQLYDLPGDTVQFLSH